MTAEEMCRSCAHSNYCMAAFQKDCWCGNRIPANNQKQLQRQYATDNDCEKENDMEICPKCKRSFPRLLALSRTDNKTMICDECGIREALGAVPDKYMSPQEKTRTAICATGNRWAIENYEATHN